MFFISRDTGFTACTRGILKTTNGGTTWIQKYTGTDQYNSLSFPDHRTGFASSVEGYVMNTTDGGESWSRSASAIQSLSTELYFVSSSVGYLVASRGAIWKTTDGGGTWSQQVSGTSQNLQSVFFTSANTGYAVGWYGTILKTTTGGNTTSVAQSSQERPEGFQLFQNYPNPFNPTTTIEYSVPERASVELKVVDVLGRVVTTLLNEEKPAGAYTVRWNADGVASGVYFYRLKAGGFVQTRKMLLVR
jgi:hypothetical protein